MPSQAKNKRKPAKEKIIYRAPKVRRFLSLVGRPFFYLFLYIGYFLLATLINTSLWTIKFLAHTKTLISSFYFPPKRLHKIKKAKVSVRIWPKLILAGLFIILLVMIGLLSYWLVLKDLPTPQKLAARDQVVSTKILDRNGQFLYKIYHNENRTPITLSQTPLYLRQATIAVEDAEFYNHHGFSWRGITRSIYSNLQSGRLEGGSTITQQLVKNALLTPERTWQRKIKELILSVWVEMTFTKDQILEMYLNQVGYGGAAYGVEEASVVYFGKSAKDLDLAEAALLAGLPGSPTTYSPFGAHPELAKQRQERVLQRMAEENYLTPDQAKTAREEKLNYIPQKSNILAPHFVMYVKDLLVKKYGENLVESGGLEVKTSLDINVQKMAEQIVANEVQKIENLHITNGAALVTNPKNGEVLAMVGSKDYFDIKNNGNFNVTTASRQPGSSIKPVNYSVALSMGFTPATVIPDTPISYQIPGQPPYTPRNYDGQFHGNVPLRIALGSSYNVPAVKVLSAIGVNKMVGQGQKMGITTWDDSSRFGLSLTLGGGEIKMTDLSVVYGVIDNLGLRVDLNPILEVKDYRGKVLEKSRCLPDQTSVCNGKAVLQPQIAYLLTDILADNSARTPAFGPHSQLVIPNHTVAVKTGTTNNLKDNWTIGYTPTRLVAVWVGNNDNSPMSYVASGVTGASPIWNKIMTNLLQDKPDEPFPVPENLIKVQICSLTGTLPCERCPTKEEYFLPGTEPQTHCDPNSFITPTPTP